MEQYKDFVYEQTTGKLFKRKKWQKREESNNYRREEWLREAKTKHTKGYLTTRFGGKSQYVHRLIWEMHYGKIPDGMFVDHIDGHKSNNKLENLRVVTARESQKNLPLTKRNKSGFLGVYKIRKGSEKGLWAAQINIDKKPKRIGAFKTAKEASDARLPHLVIHRYHPNHGRNNV